MAVETGAVMAAAEALAAAAGLAATEVLAARGRCSMRFAQTAAKIAKSLLSLLEINPYFAMTVFEKTAATVNLEAAADLTGMIGLLKGKHPITLPNLTL